MTKFLLKNILKFISFDTLVSILAYIFSYILDYAMTHASNGGWEKAKVAIKNARIWIDLVDEVYEDDTLTEEEEKKVQEAIANCTLTTSIYNLLQGKKAPRKGRSAKKSVTTKKVAK